MTTQRPLTGSGRRPLLGSRRVAGTALAAAALSIPVQIAGGADYPTVPPGLLVLGAAALVMWFAPWRVALVVATLATTFIGIGGVLAPDLREQLADPGAVLTFVGSLVQVGGLLVGLVFCVAALVETFRGRGRELQTSHGEV